MKILLVTHHFPPRYWGGGELRTYETARWLQRQKHQVLVVCIESITDGDGRALRYVEDQFPVSEDEPEIRVRRLFFNLGASPDPFLYSYANPLIGRHLRELIEDEQPDLLHLIGGYLVSSSALQAARECGIPALVTLLEFWFLCPTNILLRGDGSLCGGPFDLVDCARCVRDSKRRYRIPDQQFPSASRAFWHWVASQPGLGRALGLTTLVDQLGQRRAMLFEALVNCDAIISPSQFVIDVFTANGVPAEKIHLIGHLAQQAPLTARWGKRPSDVLRFGYLGQIIKMKGVDVLIEAFMRIEPRRAAPILKIYGNLNASPGFGRALQARARGNPNIIFGGTYDREQVYEVLEDLDVLIFPSIWYENAPRVIREAFETGTPVVATNLGSAAEYISHNVNGLLFERGDAADLARQMQRLVDDPALVSQLRAGIPRVKPVEQEMSELLQVYHNVLATRTVCV